MSFGGKKEYSIRFCGLGGMGVILSSIILGRAALNDSKNAIQTQSYGPEQRGSRVKSDLIIAEGESISYPTEKKVDILVAFSSDAYNFYSDRVKPSGLKIVNSDLIKINNTLALIIQVPASTLANELNNTKLINIIMIGALLKKSKIVSIEAITRAISETVPNNYRDLNFKAFNIGYDYL